MNELTQPNWQICHTVPSLQQHAIHLWWVNLQSYTCDIACLNAQERQRLAQFKNNLAAECFCATRSALRYLLGQYMQLSPVDVSLLIGEHGKPYVEENTPYFNLSHTGHQAVFAFSRCTNVGIDIEQQRPIQDIEAIAKRVFDPASQQQLAAEGYSLTAFLRHWVCFEARQKCTGQGILTQATTQQNLSLYDAVLDDKSHFCVAWYKTCDNPALHFFRLN